MNSNIAPGRPTAIAAIAWMLVLAVAWLAYSPGLSGGFLFDDFANLPAIGASGPVDDWPTFWRYITSGLADPTGRPLALLSFLLDARDWPADPAPFLRTNLILHLLNGTLLFALLRKLGAQLDPPGPRGTAAALLGAGLWLLHPLFVSTTLYVVQREAMLPGTFMLLGLLAFSHGRANFARSQGERGVGWMATGLVAGTGLAILCKANGLLLPLLAWVLEATVFRQVPAAPLEGAAGTRLARFRLVFFVLPGLALLLFLASVALQWDAPLKLRPWTIGQRALTESRVLLDYLHLLVVPRSVSTGLYNDEYRASTGLLQPFVTLPAMLAVAALACFGMAMRRRRPALAAALLFFLVGHAIESTVLPLELYFEHRNYVPAMLLFWPLARGIAFARIPSSMRLAIGAALLALFALTTFQRTTIWGQPETLAKLWASQNPDSSRAQSTAAASDIDAGQPQQALQRLRPLWIAHPNDLQLALNYANAACASQGLSHADAARIADSLRHADRATLLVRQWLENALGTAESGSCPGVDLATVRTWLEAARENPRINTAAVRQSSMPTLLGQLALAAGRPDQALEQFNGALTTNPSPEIVAVQVSMLAGKGYYREALAHLDYYERMPKVAVSPYLAMGWLHEKVLERQRYWPRELGILRRKLMAEIAAEKATEQAPAR